MGLSAYGAPDLRSPLRKVLRPTRGGFELGLEYFRHHTAGVAMTWEGEPKFDRLYSDRLVELLGPAREPRG